MSLLSIIYSEKNPEDMVKEVVLKLQQALELDPEWHAALLILGNAHSQQGFSTPNEQAPKDSDLKYDIDHILLFQDNICKDVELLTS
ncbi:hypothetical protein ZIOFF_025606 [Zingiber officinale]|uniref:Uncharacterized protein n=1 Tax=Zingiber officinale TaxID=94328 RepID=A0A8J5LE99_ZINOF|nr:hypothetical protein ZIOFF_025606 [Zingiber officinale]